MNLFLVTYVSGAVFGWGFFGQGMEACQHEAARLPAVVAEQVRTGTYEDGTPIALQSDRNEMARNLKTMTFACEYRAKTPEKGEHRK